MKTYEFGKGLNEAKREFLAKSYNNLDPIEKGGEGSRGGKVIGHTKSGKPIYEHAVDHNHHTFSSEDHAESAKLHNKLANDSYEQDYKKYIHHKNQSELHGVLKRHAAAEEDWQKRNKKDENVQKSEDNDLQQAYQVLGIKTNL